MFIVLVCLLLCTSFALPMGQQMTLPRSLKQKQLILHSRNLVDILFKGSTFPPTCPNAFLATIYNITQFFQEPEIASLPQELSFLYHLIQVRKCTDEDLTLEYIAQCAKTHSRFTEKLVTTGTFAQLNPHAITEQINTLDNKELKTFLHACVTFYAAQNNEQRIEAENILTKLRNRYPTTIPAVVDETPSNILNGCCVPMESQPKVRIIKIYSLQG